MSDVTQMLLAVGRGDANASEDLLPLVYDELRKHAAVRMSRESPGQTLQPTALVHEAWLRMAGSGDRHWQNRAHFFGAAAEAMRRILIENARRKARLKNKTTDEDERTAAAAAAANMAHRSQLGGPNRCCRAHARSGQKPRRHTSAATIATPGERRG